VVLVGLLGYEFLFTAGALLSLWLTVFLGILVGAAESVVFFAAGSVVFFAAESAVFFAAEFSLAISALGLTTLDFFSNSSCNFRICSYFAALSWNICSTGVTN
jgi:hypothetical protein